MGSDLDTEHKEGKSGFTPYRLSIEAGGQGEGPARATWLYPPLWNPEVHRPRGGKGSQPNPADISTAQMSLSATTSVFYDPQK